MTTFVMKIWIEFEIWRARWSASLDYLTSVREGEGGCLEEEIMIIVLSRRLGCCSTEWPQN